MKILMDDYSKTEILIYYFLLLAGLILTFHQYTFSSFIFLLSVIGILLMIFSIYKLLLYYFKIRYYKINDNLLEVKDSVFNKAKKINLPELKKVEFSGYMINLYMSDSLLKVKFNDRLYDTVRKLFKELNSLYKYELRY